MSPLVFSRNHFDPWLSVAGPTPLEVIAGAVADLLGTEAPRARRRTSAAQRALGAIIGAVLGNVIYHSIGTKKGGFIIVSLAKPRGPVDRRYVRQGFTKLPETIKTLAAGGWLRCHIGKHHGTASTISAGPRLAAALEGLAVGFEDFGTAEGQETIIMTFKTPRWGQAVGGEDGPPSTTLIRARSDLVAYRETGETRRLRAQLAAINAFIAQADLRLDCPPERDASAMPLIDTRRRLMRRHFMASEAVEPKGGYEFNRGGRGFGPFWQTMRKEDRRFLHDDD